MSDAFPMEFGRYQLIERLAVGGMAELYKARVVGAHGFQKPVVIKKILPHLAADASFVNMFIDEAKITARLDNPKIAQVLELGTIDEQLYIAMEYVDGLDVLAVLRACAQKRQPLPKQIAVHIAHEVLDALDYAHGAADEKGQPLGIVHRDISPSNVLVSRRGDVKLADFGIAHALDRQQKTQAGTLKGKYGYMSPEQVVGGSLDGRSDLFSVGIVLAEMLMGRRLFTAPNELDVLLMVRDVRLDRLDKYGQAIDPELREILLRAFVREPAARWPTAGAFRDALAEWLFAKRFRVAPSDLGALVESLYATARPLSVEPKPQPGAAQHVGAPFMGTLAGPSTKERQLKADEQVRMGREVVRRVRAEGGSEERTKDKPQDKKAEKKDGPAQVASQAPPRRTSGEIPIVLDLGDVDPASLSGAGVVAFGADDAVIIGAAPAAVRPGSPKRPAADKNLPLLDLELGPSREKAPAVTELGQAGGMSASEPAPGAGSGSPLGSPPGSKDLPDSEGDLTSTPPIRILYRLAVEKSSGLLVVEISAISKEIYIAAGTPEFVSSNVARELLGEYLVAQKVISQGELAMALAMMPHFGGKLGDTLVGLGLMKPLDVFRHLTRQVRDKIVDVCTWHKGRWRWFRGKRNPREAFPLGLDAFEVLGAGATALSSSAVESWAKLLLEKSPVAAKNPRVVPEAFRLGTYPREVYNRLDGRHMLGQVLSRFTNDDDRIVYLRTLYLLVQTDLALLE